MTDKQKFLEKLNAALKLRGVTDTDIAPYLERFDRFYERMASESGEVSDSLSDIEALADTISAQVSERYEEINRLAERTMTVDAVDTAEAPTLETDAVIANEESAVQNTEVIPEIDLYGECEPISSEELAAIIPPEELAALEGNEAAEYIGESVKLPDYTETEEIPASTTFKILSVASLPITLPLAAVFFAAFGALWLIPLSLIAASIAAVVVFSAGGAVLSLVGIVYGVIQMIGGSTAIGLYEIGLGVIAAGFAMLFGILFYNLAIRLLPILIKLIFKLFKYTLKKLEELYNHLKKESAKL